MIKLSFKSDSELQKYLIDNNLNDTIMFTGPTYVRAVIGITTDNRLVYDYDKMVETLADDYRSFGGYKNPVEEAIEWIDTNIYYVGPMSPIVVYPKPIEGLDDYLGIDGLDEELIPIEDAIIGISYNDDVLIDSEMSENFKSFFKEVMFI